jgi:hypothetical protein
MHIWMGNTRTIHGTIQYKGRWHPRGNSEIYNLYTDLNIVDDMQFIWPGWAVHTILIYYKNGR